MTAIQTRNLTKRYGSVTAVDGLNLRIDEGEVFGFLGPNGAGKSTTINMLLDFVRPTAGKVSVLGHDPRTESRAVRAKIGVLPDGYDLYDRLTARKHLEFATALEDSDDDPDPILDRVGLAGDGDRPVNGFSTGMRQRLALGMALAGDPELLILDEPSAGLDPNGIQQMRSIVREERDRGTTVFFSSHLMEQVEAVCDRVAIMRGGELVATDTVEALRESVDEGSTLVLTVDEPPAIDDLDAVDGVRAVDVTDTTLRVQCDQADAKSAVISHVERRGANVVDIDVEEASLEDAFSAYTSDTDRLERRA